MVVRVLSLLPGLRHLLRDPRDVAARRLYDECVAQARLPVFYARFGVPDTVDGRFDVISIHVFGVLRRLSTEGPDEKAFGQRVFDQMFGDIDDSLREMGVGDTRVGKKVRGLAEAFYGRVAAYGSALDDGDEPALVDAITRNVFDVEAPPIGAAPLAAYIRDMMKEFERQTASALIAGEVSWPSIDRTSDGE